MSTTVGSTGPSREVTAAVVRRQGSFEIGQARLEAPRDDEILVRIVAAGLCHTDLVVRDQLYPVPLPIVLGHEGAGVVEAVGAAVHKVAVGDHVALSFLSCAACRPCFDGSPASCANFNDMNFAGQRPDGSHAITDGDGAPINDRFFAQSSFTTYALAHERNVVKVRGGRTARTARPSRLRHPDGRRNGAARPARRRRVDAGEEIRKITGSGVDYALDTTSLPGLIRQGVDALRQRGSAAILGASAPDATLDIGANRFMQSCKTIMASWRATACPTSSYPSCSTCTCRDASRSTGS